MGRKAGRRGGRGEEQKRRGERPPAGVEERG